MSTNNTETPGAATPGEPLANIWEQLKQLDALRKNAMPLSSKPWLTWARFSGS